MASSYVSVFHIGELSYTYKMHNFLIQIVLNILRQKKKRKVLLLYHIIDKCIYSCPPCNNDMKVIMK